MDSRRRSKLQLQARSTHLIFHIGPEMVECLMRKANSAETKREPQAKPSRIKKSGEIRLQGAGGTRKPRIVDRLASALFLALRWIV
jgi:hypothetical protein